MGYSYEYELLNSMVAAECYQQQRDELRKIIEKKDAQINALQWELEHARRDLAQIQEHAAALIAKLRASFEGNGDAAG